MRAAEIDELRLNDDVAAIRTYRRLLAEEPGDDFVAERLARVAVRGVGLGNRHAIAELAPLFARRIEQAGDGTSTATRRGQEHGDVEAARTEALDLAMMLLDREPDQSAALIEAVAAGAPERRAAVPVLRMQEALARRAKDTPALARALSAEGQSLGDVRARLGALWSLATLEEWRPGLGDVLGTYRGILDLDPSDPGALDATVRIEMLNARRGEPKSRGTSRPRCGRSCPSPRTRRPASRCSSVSGCSSRPWHTSPARAGPRCCAKRWSATATRCRSTSSR